MVRSENWLDLGRIATVEVTSEDPAFPIESALCADDSSGWRADAGGEQQIRLVFDEPIALRRIQIRFEEETSERTQEFALRWEAASGGGAKEIVRQQWNFSPSGSTSEVENYAVNLDSVIAIELAIRPDLSRREEVASLASLRLA